MKRIILTLCIIIIIACGSFSLSWSDDFQKGMEAYEKGDFTNAIKEWILLAEDGDEKAQYFLGLIYYKLGYEAGHKETLRQALQCYQNALKVYSKSRTPARWAEVMSSFARTAQVFGEHVKSLEALATAANAYQAVLQVRNRKKGPLAWAATQNNLGSALFLLGKKANNLDRIEAAIDAGATTINIPDLSLIHI